MGGTSQKGENQGSGNLILLMSLFKFMADFKTTYTWFRLQKFAAQDKNKITIIITLIIFFTAKILTSKLHRGGRSYSLSLIRLIFYKIKTLALFK